MPEQISSQPAPAGAATRILVVDDNHDAASTLGDLLEMVGYEVRVAGDGKSALAQVQSFTPRLALLDIGLPDMDGYALAGQVRALPEAAGIQLVALTGYGRDTDREQARNARFDDHLVKPVEVDKLLAVMERLLGKTA